MSRMRAAAVAMVCATSACQSTPPRDILVPAGLPRATSYGDHEVGGGEIRASAEVVSGEQVHLPTRVLLAIDANTSAHVEWLPFGFKDRPDGWDRSSSAELTYGLHHRISGGDEWNVWRPAISVNVFGIAPHGGPKAARWPGVVEGEEGYFGVLAAEWGNHERSVLLNVGSGVGGRPVGNGDSGRILAGAAFTQALAGTGIGFSTEPTRIGIETHFAYDPIDDRTFGELHVGLSFWLGATEVDVGYRRGIAPDSHDDVFYIGFRSRLLDSLSL